MLKSQNCVGSAFVPSKRIAPGFTRSSGAGRARSWFSTPGTSVSSSSIRSEPATVLNRDQMRVLLVDGHGMFMECLERVLHDELDIEVVGKAAWGAVAVIVNEALRSY